MNRFQKYQENFRKVQKENFEHEFGKQMGNKNRRNTIITISLVAMYWGFNDYNIVIMVIGLIILIYNLKNEFYEEGLKEGFYSGYETGHTDGTLEEAELKNNH